MRSTKKEESGEKVLRLTDEMLEIDMQGVKQVQYVHLKMCVTKQGGKVITLQLLMTI